MSKSILDKPFFQNENAAYAKLESIIWPSGPVCVHCGDKARVRPMQGKATRAGLYKCYACRKQFRATVGTVFEASHVPLHIWMQAVFLMVSSKKGVSTHQLHRTLGMTLKSAWFVGHRIREAMKEGPDTAGEQLGGEGKGLRVTKPSSGAKPAVAPMSRRQRSRPLPPWLSAAAGCAVSISRT